MTGAGRERSGPTSLDAVTEDIASLVLQEFAGRAPTSAPANAEAVLAALDSLGRLELLAALEARFDLDLTEDLIAEFESIERIARIVREVRLEQRDD